MITAKQVKDIAALVSAVAGITTGMDKIKTTLQKWRAEYVRNREDIKDEDNSDE